MNVLRLKKDRLALLNVIRDYINVTSDNSEVEDRKSIRQLKVVKKELDKWIKEMEKEQKLSEEVERSYL